MKWIITIWIDNRSTLKYSKLNDLFKPNQYIVLESDTISGTVTIQSELGLTLQ